MPSRSPQPGRAAIRLLAIMVIAATATLAVVILTNRGGAAPPTGPGPALVDLLTVAPAGTLAGYDRDKFPHWDDADGDGCDTRDEVLAGESKVPPTRRTEPGCTIVGTWASLYDGYTTTDPAELEIDHTVALAEAWRSGADTWPRARRRAFANDLGYTGSLTAVTAATNRSKSDRDPASWQPPDHDAWCEFATSWVYVKYRWQLTADPAEVKALRNMLRDCPAQPLPPRA